MDRHPKPKTIRMLISGLDRLISSASRHQVDEDIAQDLDEMIARRRDLADQLTELEESSSSGHVLRTTLGSSRESSTTISAIF